MSWRDRLPAAAGVIMGVLLWSVIFTGAGLLLNSVIEEKGNRILEVLLSSASSAEILGGKILGGAAVTATVLGLWGTVGRDCAGPLAGPPSLGSGPSSRRSSAHGHVVYFAVYLVIGYLMYASIFAGIGAFCETPAARPRPLLGPLMLILTIPMHLHEPGDPASRRAGASCVLSWVPLFCPS